MKRYWLFYGWYDTYEDAGNKGGLLDLIDWFDSVEAAYVAFGMAPEREWWGKPEWCVILDIEEKRIEKVVGIGDGGVGYLKQFFKLAPGSIADKPAKSPDIDFYDDRLSTHYHPLVKPDNFGLLHDPSLCSNSQCECHTVESKRVATPFPIEAGNPYCCNKCALQPGFGGTRGDLIRIMGNVPGTFAIVAPNDQKTTQA